MKRIYRYRFLRLSLLLLCLSLLGACTQTPASLTSSELLPTAFGTTQTDGATGLARHATGVYAVGYTTGRLHATNKGSFDAFVRKYSASGSVLWGRQFGTTAADFAESAASDGSDNLYVGGWTCGNLSGSRGGCDAFLRKYTPSGGVAWTRQFGTSSQDDARKVGVYANTIYVAGTTEGALAGSSGEQDVFLRKYNAQGSVLWTRQFGTPRTDVVTDMAVDGMGNAYVVGWTYGTLTGSGGVFDDMFIRKYSASGTVLWTAQQDYGNSDQASAVVVSGDRVYLFGHSYSANRADVRIIQFTALGETVWDKLIEAAGDNFVSAASIDGSGNLYLSGTTEAALDGSLMDVSDTYISKLDAEGSPLWSTQLGTRDFDDIPALLARSSSQLYAAGWTFGTLGSANRGGQDAFLRRLRGANGSVVWTDQ